MSFKEKLKTLLQTKFVKKTCMVFSLIAMTSALALAAIACTPESVQDPSSSPITTSSDDSKPSEVTPGDETTDDETTDDETTDPENPDITDPETPTEPEDPGITEPEDPDITEPTDPENPDITDPETPVDPEEPEIEDPTPEVSFEDVYNEIFGKNYEFVPFENYMQQLAERVFSTSTDVKFLLAETTPDSFVIYADAAYDETRRCLLQGTLKADPYAPIYSPILYNLYDLTRQSEAAGGFKQYMQQVYESYADASSARAELETISADLNQSVRVSSGLVRGSFDTTRPVTNTRDDIVIEDYIDVFLPEGATPLKLYIRALRGSIIDSTKMFNTGYYETCESYFIYLDTENNAVVEEYRLFFPSYTNDTPKTVYDRLLKEEGTYHKKSLQSTDILENPIISEELLANIENTQ